MSEATKASSVVTYDEELPTIKLHGHLNKCLSEVTRQMKNNKCYI